MREHALHRLGARSKLLSAVSNRLNRVEWRKPESSVVLLLVFPESRPHRDSLGKLVRGLRVGLAVALRVPLMLVLSSLIGTAG
jgi:hypothetical protein